ncbi:MAG: hypothetical protein WBD40_03600 [Tepidisphaeraceae bacterium]
MLDTTAWRTDRVRWCALAGIVWGLLLFPGGYYATAIGAVAAIIAFPMRAAGALVRRMLARAYRMRYSADRRSPYPWAALVLVLAASTTGSITKLSLAIHAPLLRAYAQRVHESEPFIGQRILVPRMVGLLGVVGVENRPSGLRLFVGPGCALTYDPEGFTGDADIGVLGPKWHINLLCPFARSRYRSSC